MNSSYEYLRLSSFSSLTSRTGSPVVVRVLQPSPGLNEVRTPVPMLSFSSREETCRMVPLLPPPSTLSDGNEAQQLMEPLGRNQGNLTTSVSRRLLFDLHRLLFGVARHRGGSFVGKCGGSCIFHVRFLPPRYLCSLKA